MKRKWLAVGISITAVILLTLTSFSNVVGYQTIQTSQQNLIIERINQKELLFQTIVDITNNKEIQRIILKSQINRGLFPTSDIPFLTKNQLKVMYLVGLMLSKINSKAKIHSMVEKYQFISQGMQKEINAVIEKDAILKDEITQLSNYECDCENDNITTWFFPVLCTLLFPLVITLIVIILISHQVIPLIDILMNIGLKLHCFWYLGPL